MALGSLEPLPFRHGYVATLSTHSGDSFGGVVSGLLLFIATPQLNLRLASSLAGEHFGTVQTPTLSLPVEVRS